MMVYEEVLCHEMFQHVFGIDVDIFQGSDKPFLHRNEFLKGRRAMQTEERITTELVREFVMADSRGFRESTRAIG